MVGSNEGNLDEGARTTDRSNQTGGTSTLSGVDLRHPPKGIENLPDTEKRFLAGAIRESYVQGLNECGRNPGAVSKDRNAGFRLADQWIGQNFPMLAGIVGDVGSGAQSNR